MQTDCNNGDGTFTDIVHAAGVDRVAYTKGVAAADYDNDEYMDRFARGGCNSWMRLSRRIRLRPLWRRDSESPVLL